MFDAAVELHRQAADVASTSRRNCRYLRSPGIRDAIVRLRDAELAWPAGLPYWEAGRPSAVPSAFVASGILSGRRLQWRRPITRWATKDAVLACSSTWVPLAFFDTERPFGGFADVVAGAGSAVS